MSKATAREQARDKAQEISDLANLIRNAVDAGLYHSAQEKLDLLAHEIADLAEALNRLRLIEQHPLDYEHPDTQEQER
jgi:hypothetical protein